VNWRTRDFTIGENGQRVQRGTVGNLKFLGVQ